MDNLDIALLVGAAAVLAAIGAVRLAHIAGLPSLLAYLGLGLLLGQSGAGIQFNDVDLAHTLGLTALILILAEGGITTSWPEVRPAMFPALVLSTLGTAVSVGIVAVAVHFLLGLDIRLSLLLGAVLAPTDAAAVFSVLRRLPLPSRLAGVLEAESGLNDAPTLIIVTLLASGTAFTGPEALLHVGYELVLGTVVGLTIGPLGAYVLRRVALPASGLYPIAAFALIVSSYGAASALHASGFLAVYLCALILGNAGLPHGPATRGFAEGIAWIAQIGLFIMLGLLASPERLPSQLIPALVAGAVLVLLARPASVAASLGLVRLARTAMGWLGRISRAPVLTWRDQTFLSWAGLRGAIPIVLATVPMSAGLRGADQLFDLVFVIVVVFTWLQGPTLPWAATRLGVTEHGRPHDLDVEAAPLEELHAELLQTKIPPGSRLNGVEIFELRLPRDAAITLIVRERKAFVPESSTVLHEGDELLVVTTLAERDRTERRLRAVSRRGKLAGWYGEGGEPD